MSHNFSRTFGVSLAMTARNPDFELQPCTYTAAATDAAVKFCATEQNGREDERDAIAGMYRSLPVTVDCIRILRVCTREGSWSNDTPLDCRLYVADLRSAPSYTALSYVWGQENSPDRHIICNGLALSVTSNCYSALQHLHASIGTFDIWVDAICINQKDQDEKMHQINLMGDIYSQASITYIWLGPGDAATNRVAGFLGKVGFLEHFFHDSSTRKHVLKRPNVWSAALQYMSAVSGLRRSTVPYDRHLHQFLCWEWSSSPKDNQCTFDELDHFLDCSWITRIWTYQEIILSSNPVVVRGETHTSWNRLAFSLIFLSTIRGRYSRFDRYDMSAHSSDLHHWVDTMFARELFQTRAIVTNEGETQMFTRYWSFCRSIQTKYSRLRQLRWLLMMCISLGVTTLFTNRVLKSNLIPPLSKSWATRVGLAASFFGSFLLMLGLVMELTLPPLVRYSPYSTADRAMLANMERRIRSDAHERILDILRTRIATEPRDMSFGLHSILVNLPGDTELPIINHHIPLSKVYLQLTQFLLNNSKSLGILTLARQHRCQGAPSWVPNYSLIGDNESLDAQIAKMWQLNRKDAENLARTVLQNEADVVSICAAVYGCECPFRYHETNGMVLVVKGLVLGRIIAIGVRKRHEGDRIENAVWLETGSYEGLSIKGCRIGDKLVLIVGFQQPLVVRDDGDHVRIIGAVSISYREDGIHLRRKDHIRYGETWRAHDKKRKEKWKRENGWTDLEAEPHPSTYLEDILIS